MPGQHRAGEVVEASRASFAPIPLSVNLALSKPSRTTVLLPHAGQWTPSGQRCWRTRAKHLASSISAERLTRSDTAILEGPHAGWPARAVLADYYRGPAGRLPRPPPTTPEPNKSRQLLPRLGRTDAGPPAPDGALPRHSTSLSCRLHAGGVRHDQRQERPAPDRSRSVAVEQ